MSDLGKEFAVVTRHIRNLRGRSHPILTEANDGLLYVVKFANGLHGTNLPFNESVGTELYHACGLACPSWKILLITETFLDLNQDCWMDTPFGRVRPDAGFYFGSRVLGGHSSRLLEILPRTSFKCLVNRESFWLALLIDVCTGHSGHRQAIFLEESAGWLDAVFVDHGCLFGVQNNELQQDVLAARYLDPRIYESVSSLHLRNCKRVLRSLDGDRLWQRIQGLPNDWKTQSALAAFASCLTRLSTPHVVEDVVDTIVEALRQADEREERRLPCE
jgi:hypothetical protein